SRRRHTISKRDWSSDVCSSDLDLKDRLVGRNLQFDTGPVQGDGERPSISFERLGVGGGETFDVQYFASGLPKVAGEGVEETGRPTGVGQFPFFQFTQFRSQVGWAEDLVRANPYAGGVALLEFVGPRS